MSRSSRGCGYDIVGISRTMGFNGHVRSKSAKILYGTKILSFFADTGTERRTRWKVHPHVQRKKKDWLTDIKPVSWLNCTVFAYKLMSHSFQTQQQNWRAFNTGFQGSTHDHLVYHQLRIDCLDVFRLHLNFTCALFLSLCSATPRFTRTPEDQTGIQGGVASFVCQATGDPQPKIVWNKKGKKVSNQRFEVHRSFVFLLSVVGSF